VTHEPTGTDAIVVEDVWKRFRKSNLPAGYTTLKSLLLGRARKREGGTEYREVLRGISFRVGAGETWGILGPNGVGKSTLLRLLTGIYRPDRGRITVKGRVASLLELGAGFHPEFSGRENVTLNGIVLGMSKREIQERYDKIVAFAELEEYMDEPVRTYSTHHGDPRCRLRADVLSPRDPAGGREDRGPGGAGRGRRAVPARHARGQRIGAVRGGESMTKITIDELTEIVERELASAREPSKSGMEAAVEADADSEPSAEQQRAAGLVARLDVHRDCTRPLPLKSPRARIGAAVSFTKRAVRRVFRPFIQDAQRRQHLFNDATFEAVEDLFRRNAQLERRIMEWSAGQEQMLAATLRDLMDELRRAAAAGKDQEELRRDLARMVGGLDSAGYARFHKTGSSFEMSLDLFRRYVPRFEGRRRVVDLGCGRGPFLSVAQEAGIPAYGVDTNAELVAEARGRGFEVVEEDALSHLEQLDPGDVDGVFAAHLVEHLPTADLMRFFRLAWRALPADGVLVIESPNTESLGVMAHGYYRDATHVAPRHPEAYRFFAEACGFEDTGIDTSLPFGPEQRLIEIPETEAADSALRQAFNENARRLNALLWGDCNFAITAYRREPPPA